MLRFFLALMAFVLAVLHPVVGSAQVNPNGLRAGKLYAYGTSGKLMAQSTGFWFRSGNKEGVLTTLHGVAGAGSIKLFLEGMEDPVELSLAEVAIKNDLAICQPRSSNAWSVLRSAGLIRWEVQAKLSTTDLAARQVWYYGYFKNDDLYSSPDATLYESNHFKPIGEVLPQDGAARQAFAERGSPSVRSKVLLANAQAGPGFSGGPVVLNQNGKPGPLVGVIVGGKAFSASSGQQQSWIMPISGELLKQYFIPFNQEVGRSTAYKKLTSGAGKLWYGFEQAEVCEVEFVDDGRFKVLIVWDSTDANSFQVGAMSDLYRKLANTHRKSVEVAQCNWAGKMFSQAEAHKLEQQCHANLILFSSGKTGSTEVVNVDYFQIETSGLDLDFFPPDPNDPLLNSNQKEYPVFGRISGDVSLLVSFILYEQARMAGANAWLRGENEEAEYNFVRGLRQLAQMERNHAAGGLPPETKPCFPYLKAKIYVDWKKYEEATGFYTAALAENPEHTSILFSYAIFLHNQLNEWQQAEELLARCGQLYADRFDLAGEGKCLFQAGTIASLTARLSRADSLINKALFKFKVVDDAFNEAHCLSALGGIAFLRSDKNKAEQLFHKALALFEEIKAPFGQAFCYSNLGSIAFRWASYDEADTLFQKTLGMYKQYGYFLGEANCLKNLGEIRFRRGDYVGAEDLLKEALSMYRTYGTLIGEANSLNSLGDIALQQNHLEEGQGLFEQAIGMYRKLGSPLGEANCLSSLGAIALRKSDMEAAESDYQKAMTLYQSIEQPLGVANSIKSLGDIAYRLGQNAKADSLFKESLTRYIQLKNPIGEANSLSGLGDNALIQQENAAAEDWYVQALEIYERIGFTIGIGNVTSELGEVALRKGDFDLAKGRFEKALPLFQQLGDAYREAVCWQGLGKIAAQRMEEKDALEFLNRARATFAQYGDLFSEANCLRALGFLYLDLKEEGKALEWLDMALEKYKAIGDSYDQALVLARMAGDLPGQPERAAASRRQAIDLFKGLGLTEEAERLEKP